jgi:hypothetical protein
MKKILAFLTALAVSALTAISAGAENSADAKSYTLSETPQQSGVITEEPAEPAFWELPQVPAGQVLHREGTLTLKNTTGLTADMKLDTVSLPYDNPEALEYLNHLIITVKDGDTVLYEGPYSRINDEGGLRISLSLESGAVKTYTIGLRCDFSYTGDLTSASQYIAWMFSASAAADPPSPQPVQQQLPRGAMILLCAAGGLVVLCAVIGGVRVFLNSRRKGS